MLPVVINVVHDFLNHEHIICSSKTEKHLHEKDIKCDLNLIKQTSFVLATNYYKIKPNTIIFNNDSLQYSFLKNHYKLSFSLRGPPIYVQLA